MSTLLELESPISPERIESYKKYENNFIGKTVVEKDQNIKNLYKTNTTITTKNGEKTIESLLISCDNIANLPEESLALLMDYYRSEFDRPGSYMDHPDKGWVSVFKLDGKDLGFFYLGENEVVENGLIPSVVDHIKSGLVTLKEFPDVLFSAVIGYINEVSEFVNLSEVGKEVARPMRFLIYPEMQGKGGLNILLSLLTISTALVNNDRDEIYQVIEARAGVSDAGNSDASATSVEGHQLIPVYLNKAMELLNVGPHGLLSWINDPYQNLSLARKIDVKAVLSLLKKY